MLLSQADFAKLANVNRVQITKGLKAKRLTRNRDGFMATTERKNAAYLKKHKAKIPRAPRKAKKEEPLPVQNLKASIRMKNARAARDEQTKARELGRLILAEIVEQKIAMLGSELKAQLFTLPRAVSAEIVSRVKAGRDAAEIEVFLSEQISRRFKIAKERAIAVNLESFDA